ncbi:MAG: (2Fe-2S)-binding protein [Candidatus Marinimicrobia bacterium]|nr:(2Fe-2S)-binding protein [FCB group bacterium]MBL7025751.1 (2Fe-2S)-binding protein [Candidatus Neomarinimicrobiota bacterium]
MITKVSFQLNGQQVSVEVDPKTPLLWVIRDTLGFTGTKYSCGIGICGSCTVHIEGKTAKSCITPVASVENKSVTTIEGLAKDGLHAVQQAWVDEEVPQCGYCQPGQIMTAVELLENNSNPTDAEIDAAMKGVLCRCGTYQRIRKAIHTVSGEVQDD